jgi:uncharacterized YigZ family protein
VRDSYRTIGSEGFAEIPRIKGSRFLAEAWPVSTCADADVQVEAIRKREHAAAHHCFAYRIGPEGASTRFSDDGEPSGSAGMPILRRIEGRDLTNLVVVVTRYFGGVKLGTGGLARAYGDASDAVLNQTPVVEQILRVPVRIRFDYADTSPALHVLSRFDTITASTRYGDRTEMVLDVRVSQVDEFLTEFIEGLRGKGDAERVTQRDTTMQGQAL